MRLVLLDFGIADELPLDVRNRQGQIHTLPDPRLLGSTRCRPSFLVC